MKYKVTSFKEKDYERFYFVVTKNKLYHSSDAVFTTIEDATNAGWQAVWTMKHFKELERA